MTSALYAAVPGNPAPVDAVLREWSLAHWSEPVSVVYVDRAASCVKRLCEKLRPGVQDAVREWTVRTGGFRVAAGDLPGLAHAGVTRLCLVLDAGDTGGLASYAGAARQAGVQSLAVDLNVDGIGTEAVEACIRSGVDHVSTYGEGEGTASGVDRAAELLEGAGYERYELWSFARPGHACRYTELCWRCGNYLGLGPGAASHLAGRRWSNTADPAAYAAALSEGRRPPREVVELTPESLVDEMAAFGLNLREGIEREGIVKAAARAFPRLGNAREKISQHWRSRERLLIALETDGLVERRGERWALTSRGLEMADHVACELLGEA